MTSGEKAIWAATFVYWFERSQKNSPHDVHSPGNEEAYKEWHEGNIQSAIEHAGYSVEYVCKSVDSIREGYGEDSSTYKLLKEMLKV